MDETIPGHYYYSVLQKDFFFSILPLAGFYINLSHVSGVIIVLVTTVSVVIWKDGNGLRKQWFACLIVDLEWKDIWGIFSYMLFSWKLITQKKFDEINYLGDICKL